MATACSSEAPRLVRIERVTPDANPGCGAPDDARTLVVTALGEFPATEATARSVDVSGGAEVDIDGFPPDTNSLEVEVRGFGGAVRAVGRTPLFDLDDLDDGDRVPVFMAPLDGFCPTGPPAHARSTPLLARAGAQVLIAGGDDAGGNPVHEVEIYDPATGQFSGLGRPLYGSELAGLAGASMTALDDGRVVVAGGGATAYQVYDPDAGEFGSPQFLREARARHAAAALDGDRLFLAGGCARLEGSQCAADSGLTTSVILSVSTGELSDGPRLALIRFGAGALREADGRVLLVGGVDADGNPVNDAERLDPERPDRAGELIAGSGGAAALLAGGGALTGFAPLGAAPTQAAAVVPPGGMVASQVAGLTPRAGAALVALESGQVLVLGGSGDEGAPALYQPASGTLAALAAEAGGRSGHAAVRLDDGSVLVIGGRDGDGEARDDAWIFRPALVGPWSGGLSATFATAGSASAIVPRDPARARAIAADGAVPAHYRIEASGDGDLPGEWAVLAGPRFTTLTLEASVAAEQGGVAALLWFRDEATTAAVLLHPEEEARLVQLAAGDIRSLGDCIGQTIAAADLAPPAGAAHALAIRADGGELVAALDGREVLRCAVTPPGPGLVGVGPLGGEGAVLRLDLIGASR